MNPQPGTVPNKVLLAGAEPDVPHQVFSAPIWTVYLARIMAACLALLVCYFAVKLQSRLPQYSTGLLFFAAAALIVIAAFAGTPGKVHFICDRKGFYFPERRTWFALPWARTDNWLFVPWENIADIRIEHIIHAESVSSGIVFSIKATHHESRTYFSGLLISHTQNYNSVETHNIGYGNGALGIPGNVIKTILRFRGGLEN